MVQQLTESLVLPQDPTSVPSILVGQLTATCNSNFRGLWCPLLASMDTALVCT